MKISKKSSVIAPFLGMVLFWTYFRFQAFFGGLFPLEAEIPLWDISVQVYVIFLLILFLLSLASAPFASKIELLLFSRPNVALLLSSLGTLGVVTVMLVHQQMLASWMSLVAVVLVSVSFLSSYFAWASYFSFSFSLKSMVLLAASFLASILFSSVFSFFPELKSVSYLIIPLGTGLAWYFSTMPSRTEKKGARESLRTVNLFVSLFIAFLLAGSVMRGIIDVGSEGEGIYTVRLAISIVIACLVLLASWIYQRRRMRQEERTPFEGSQEYREIERYTLKWWLALALLFFLGLFICLIPGLYDLGGHIVVIARSTLDLFLWILLCSLVRYENASPAILFIVCSIFVEIASWTSSYVIMPHLLNLDTGLSIGVPEMAALAVSFMLIAVMILAFAAVFLRRRNISEDIGNEARSGQEKTNAKVPEDMIARYRLTRREADVISLFSQGLSLKKVASMLFISTSTAQSHIKSIYKKLDIHSKDELIEMTKGWD